MKQVANHINGRCHCGNIRYQINTETPTDQIIARACDCSFCRIHGAKNWSEPNAHAVIEIRDKALLQEYYFGLKLCPFYICRQCGAYVGAVYSEYDKNWATLNLRLSCLQDTAEKAINFAGESANDRIARRKRVWMPVIISLN